MSKAAVILAAGQGTRMKSALPKVLHKVAGLPMLGHVITALRGAGVDRIVVVTSAAGETVRDYARSMGCESTIQHQQLGTGHAAASAAEARTGLALLAFEPADAGAYGRVLLTPDGFLNRIVEYKDASESERGVALCNGGCYAARAPEFFRWAASLKNNNAQGE